MAYYFSITIDKTKVTGVNTNFLYMFSEGCFNVPAGFYAHVSDPTGLDIRFYDTDDLTELKREIVLFDGVNSKVEAWVQIPILNTSVDKVIYCRYGGATLASDTSVWSDINALGVWHLQNSLTGAIGSTGVDHGASYADNKIHRGVSIPGSPAYIDMGAMPTFLNADNFSFLLWMKTSQNGWASMFHAGNGVESRVILDVTDTGKARFYLKDNQLGMLGADTIGVSDVIDGVWHRIAGVKGPTDTNIYIYVDGVLENSNSPVYAQDFTNFGTTLQLGRNPYPAEYFTGELDEIQIVKTALNSSWIATEFANQNSPQTFSYAGVETPLPVPASLLHHHHQTKLYRFRLHYYSRSRAYL